MSFPASTLCIDSLASYLALKRQENALIELRNDLQKIADRLAEYENYAWDMFQDIENVQKVITEVGTEKELKDGTILPIGHVMTSVVDMENIIGSIVKHEEHEEELTCLLDRSLKNFQQAGDSEKIQSAIERLRTEIYMDKSFFSNFTKTGVPYPKKDQEENMREGELQERKEVNDAYWSKVQKLNLNIGRFESKLSLLKDRKEEIDRANSSDPKHDTEIMVDVWGDPLPTGNDFGDIEQAIGELMASHAVKGSC